MSIHAALGHKIQLLEKRNGIAKEAIEVLLDTLDSLIKDDPSTRERYAPVVETARKALEAVAHS